MLNVIMQLQISARLTSQVKTITCHHMKKILLKKYKNTGTKPKLIC